MCEGPRDEKKLIIDNIMWADLNNVFIYRTIQKATSCDINFPMRFTAEGTKASHGFANSFFLGLIDRLVPESSRFISLVSLQLWMRLSSILFISEAATVAESKSFYHKVNSPTLFYSFFFSAAGSLKRKEEFEGKLGRLIKPTQRMMELVIKILPDEYVPNLDDACGWFPYQAVIGCDLVADEMGYNSSVVFKLLC